ncbi:hypothetical protein GGE65_003301 [Skermanella aerolata]|uniref:Uncharacterized protein n=1 Tax=Skermanella aerolata TaxID=393310 RepID=A0A512DSH3_9PROT|nr:hypothetical protein [Skermanella aerolata]KJB96180.1 hypothetical protein N826_38225 [Skermanella aerolata KACC 11604]GEO39438.1 hypothetical protein SAE02_35860 [Skermanella aerolata]
MSENDKTQPSCDDAASDNLSADALEQTMEEVVETLALTHQAAGFFQKGNRSPREKARSEQVRQTAEAMLNAAADQAGGGCKQQQEDGVSLDDPRIVH